MFFHQEKLTTEQFLRDYWQRKPLLLRQAFPGFEAELDADDIAGRLRCPARARLDLAGAGCRETLPAAASTAERVFIPPPLAHR
jgi:hypothetical protein